MFSSGAVEILGLKPGISLKLRMKDIIYSQKIEPPTVKESRFIKAFTKELYIVFNDITIYDFTYMILNAMTSKTSIVCVKMLFK